jgi:hypothetical protein
LEARGIGPPRSASFALASEASGQREHSTMSRAGSSLRSAARRGALFQLSYASRKKTNGRRSCFASRKERQSHERRPISGRSRCQTARPLFGRIQMQSRIRARVGASGNRLENAGSGKRMRVPMRARTAQSPYQAWIRQVFELFPGHRPLLPVRRRVGPAAG